MKLFFWPTRFWTFVQRGFITNFKNYLCIKTCGITCGLVSIPILFYTYNGAIGKSPDWLNIVIFFVSVAICYLYEYRLFRQNNDLICAPKLSYFLLCIYAWMFVIFTFITPEIGLFKDPLTGNFGI